MTVSPPPLRTPLFHGFFENIKQVLLSIAGSQPPPPEVPLEPTWGRWFTSVFEALKELLAAAARPVNGDWIALPLQNGWIDLDPTMQSARYRKTADGQVYIEALLTNGTSANGTIVFTLPDGFRRHATMRQPIAYNDGVQKEGQLLVGIDGTAKLYGPAGANCNLFIEMSYWTD
jgi:hypothetical protein